MTIDGVAEQILIYHPFAYNTSVSKTKKRTLESTKRTVHHDMSRSPCFTSDGLGNWRLLKDIENKLPSRAGKNFKAKQRKAQRGIPTATTVAQVPQSETVASTTPASVLSHPSSSQPSGLQPTPASVETTPFLWMPIPLSHPSAPQYQHHLLHHPHNRGSSAPTATRMAHAPSYHPYPRSSRSQPPKMHTAVQGSSRDHAIVADTKPRSTSIQPGFSESDILTGIVPPMQSFHAGFSGTGLATIQPITSVSHSSQWEGILLPNSWTQSSAGATTNPQYQTLSAPPELDYMGYYTMDHNVVQSNNLTTQDAVTMQPFQATSHVEEPVSNQTVITESEYASLYQLLADARQNFQGPSQISQPS
ncbi:hypothetical protein FRC03_010220 [Tulasnella sp. 419]|nr:hypothetical protein FRC03_010220 [Tulasnella sp. 419]